MKRNNISPSNHLRTNLCAANSQILKFGTEKCSGNNSQILKFGTENKSRIDSQILKFVIERKNRILRIMALALLLIVGQGEGFSQTLSQNT
ncbi:MAG: hypothetical protein IJ176_05740, partial [Prevotella sp.]|nr:hypothetical protein [Prevotella sp.]